MHKVYVLLSGGIDSTTTLAHAIKDFPDAEFEAVSVDYGQRHVREMESAARVVEHFQQLSVNIMHFVQPLRGIMYGMLVDKGENNEVVPDVDYADLPEGISPTYVSFRNGLMMSVLAARAQSWVMRKEHDYKTVMNQTFNTPNDATAEVADQLHGNPPEKFEATIYCGIHADDGANWAYPDCSPEFFGAMANAIYVGTYFKVRLRAPLLHMTKAEVTNVGVQLGAPLGMTWSCYKGEQVHCGTCPTCRSRKQGFALNGFMDPTAYEA